MKTGLSLIELARKIEAQKELKQDYITTEARMMLLPGDKTETARPALIVEGQGTFGILETAHDQLAARLQIPKPYYERMRTSHPELLSANVNTWLSEGGDGGGPKKRMIRTLGGDARAVLSPRYQRIENEHVAEVALPILMNEMPGVQVMSCEVTERRLYIHFVLPTVQGEVKRGDIVQAGGIISNSEIGQGSISVSGLVWRLVCLNGMKSGETFRRAHIGREIEDNAALWAEDTVRSDDRTVLLKVRDMIRAVVDETKFRAQVEKMSGLTTARMTGSPEKVIEVLGRVAGFNDGERGGILRALIEGGDTSAWGLLNAVTAQAHDAPTYDRAVEFEAAGGALLDLPATEWKRILEAA